MLVPQSPSACLCLSQGLPVVTPGRPGPLHPPALAPGMLELTSMHHTVTVSFSIFLSQLLHKPFMSRTKIAFFAACWQSSSLRHVGISGIYSYSVIRSLWRETLAFTVSPPTL